MILYETGELVKYTLKSTRDDKKPATFTYKYMNWREFKKWSERYSETEKNKDDDVKFTSSMDVYRKQFLENVTEVSGIYNSSGSELTDPRDVVDRLSIAMLVEICVAMKDSTSLNEAQVKNSERDSATHSNEVKKTESPSDVAIAATLKTKEIVEIENG